MIRIKTLELELDDLNVFATYEVDEYGYVDNIEYEVDVEVDDHLDQLILGCLNSAIEERINEIEF